MNLMGISTISSYIQGLKLDMKRQERMDNLGKQKKDEEIDPKVAEMKRWVESERRGQEIASIKSKMMSGSYLTAEERDYLKTNCPELYEEAEKVQREREAYKKALENCMSKEDVDKLHQQKMDSFYSEAKQIMVNPHIPKLKKAIMLEYVTMRMNAVGRDHSEFIKSDRYQALPDERYEKKENASESNNEAEQMDESVDNTDDTTRNDSHADSDVSEVNTETKPADPAKAVHEMLTSLTEQLPSRKRGSIGQASGNGNSPAPVISRKHTIADTYNTYAKQNISSTGKESVNKNSKTSVSI